MHRNKSTGLLLTLMLLFSVLLIFISSCDSNQNTQRKPSTEITGQETETEEMDETSPVYAILVIPRNPAPGQAFRILATGVKNNRKAKIVVSGPSGSMESVKSKNGNELPYWRLDDFSGSTTGKYRAVLSIKNSEVCTFEFEISPPVAVSRQGTVWKTQRGWDPAMELFYSAWVNALFQGFDEQSSWPSLHEVTQNRDRNILHNCLSLGEDDPENKNRVIMEPDCADNPFFLRVIS